MKKRFFIIMLTISLVISFFPPKALMADDGIGVVVNGTRVQFNDQSPVNVDGRILVPVRGVFEALGFYIDWDAERQTVILKDAHNEIILIIGQRHLTANGKRQTANVGCAVAND
jgi:hypothetical protein